MDLDGTYKTNPDASATFDFLYGTEVSTDSSSIQRSLDGFTLDKTEDKSAKIKVVDSGLVLKVYYARNTYTLSKSYTNPGEDHAVTVSKNAYFGAPVGNFFEGKPSRIGYTFVGWLFGDSGSEPETVPAKDVTATGTFNPQSVKYYINYYLQNIDGDQSLDTYSPAGTVSYNAVTGQEITISGDGLTAFEGYEFEGVSASFGRAGGETMPSGQTFITLTKEATYGDELHFNAYYKRSVPKITLNLWQGTVGLGTPKYTKTWSVPYGTVISANEYASYSEENWVPDPGYKLASYADWSTGQEPATMPAGDVTINRQYIQSQDRAYKLEVYVESRKDNVFDKKTFTYYGSEGAVASIGGDGMDDNADATVKYSSLKGLIPHFEDYEVQTISATDLEKISAADGKKIEGPTVTSGTITNVEDTQDLVLRIFLFREEKTVTIDYTMVEPVGDNGAMKETQFATVTKKVKWGNDFAYEPLAFFEDTTKDASKGFIEEPVTKNTNNVHGTSPEQYNFKRSSYIVSYTGYYYLDDEPHYPGRDFNTVDSLSENRLDHGPAGYTSYDGIHGSDTVIHVYYTKVDPTTYYYLDVYYNNKRLSLEDKQEQGEFPLTVSYNGKEHKIRLASEAMFYEDTKYKDDEEFKNSYPGLAAYNLKTKNSASGSYQYADNAKVKTGYTPIQLKGTDGKKRTYFEDNDGYIYIPVSSNGLFAGKRFSYYYGGKDDDPHPQDLSYDWIQSYLSAYKEKHKGNPRADGAYVYLRHWGENVVEGNSRLVIKYEEGPVVHLYFNIGDARCAEHIYAKGTSVPTKDLVCGHTSVFGKRSGYHITWYTDSTFKTKADKSFVINEDTNLYGRYEKDVITNHEYVYYELKDHLTIGDREYTYITENDLKALKEKLTSSVNTESVSLEDQGIQVSVSANTTRYYLDGEEVMVDREVPSLAFTSVSMKAKDFEKPGIPYDEANASNTLQAYVQDKPVNLRAYFKRNLCTLIIDEKQDEEKNNPTSVEHRFGETIQVEAPTRDGYTFKDWTWTFSKDNQQYDSWIQHPLKDDLTGAVTFSMPDAKYVKMTAQWEAASYSQKIVHHYQNQDLAYTDDPASVSENTVEFLQDSEGNKVGDNIHVQDDKAYQFAYAVLQYKDSVTKLEAGDTFTSHKGMQLDYYYERRNYSVSINKVVLDGNESVAKDEVTVLGDGNYTYGKNVTISAAPASGYELEGWYVKNAQGKLVPVTDGITSDKTNSYLSFTVDGNSEYTVKVRPIPVDKPRLTLDGTQSLTYGYRSSDQNAVRCRVDFGENAGGATVVQSYEWYSIDEKGNEKLESGAKAPTFLIPEGWNAGKQPHKVYVKVTATRKDNGKSATVTSAPYEINVGPTDMNTSVENFVGLYDGQKHNITVNVNDLQKDRDYKIYYSWNKLENPEDLEGEGVSVSADEFAQTDVCVVDGEGTDENGRPNKERGTYTLYYYIKSLNSNYKDAKGSGTIDIHPVEVKLQHKSGAGYHKIYDGHKTVLGDVNQPGTDMYELAHAKYAYYIENFPEDLTSQYVIDAEAEFNSKHVKDAKVVTLSFLKMVNAQTRDINYNYIFAGDNATVDLPAYIQPRNIELTWDQDDFVYNGKEQGPTATISGNGIDIPECDRDNIKIKTTGRLINAGEAYPAVASISLKDGFVERGIEDETRVGDYVINSSTISYKIRQRRIEVRPVDERHEYNGQVQTLKEFTLSGNGLAENHRYTVKTDKGYKNVIVNGEIKAADMHIFDERDVDVTDNYDVQYKTGYLTIVPRTVSVHNIFVGNKKYDGNASASLLTVQSPVFNGMIEGDKLGLDLDPQHGYVHAAFENETAGKDKTVYITLSANVLIGESARNYRLDVEGSQKTAQADIYKIPVIVSANSVETVYGENASFSPSFSGFINGDEKTIVNDEFIKNITYQVARRNGDQEDRREPYSCFSGNYTSAGTYTIYPDVSSLSSSNAPASGTPVFMRGSNKFV